MPTNPAGTRGKMSLLVGLPPIVPLLVGLPPIVALVGLLIYLILFALIFIRYFMLRKKRNRIDE